MAKSDLEERVAALEREVAELREAMANGGVKKDWRQTVGIFTGNEVMRQIDEAALKYREADRRKTRRRPTRSSQAKK